MQRIVFWKPLSISLEKSVRMVPTTPPLLKIGCIERISPIIGEQISSESLLKHYKTFINDPVGNNYSAPLTQVVETSQNLPRSLNCTTLSTHTGIFSSTFRRHTMRAWAFQANPSLEKTLVWSDNHFLHSNNLENRRGWLHSIPGSLGGSVVLFVSAPSVRTDAATIDHEILLISFKIKDKKHTYLLVETC